MNKYFPITLLLILASNIVLSQTTKIDIIGNWIKVKAERKDGSKIIDRIGIDTAFLEYSFTAKEFSSQFSPIEKKIGYDYDIKNDRIYIVETFNEYKIEKLTNDTLVLLDVFQKEQDHKSNRYYFVKKNTLSKKFPIKSKDNIPIYNKYNAPRVHKIFKKYLSTCNAGNSQPFKFKGFLVFDQKEKRITANLNFFNDIDKNKKNTLKACIENTYQYWDFTEAPDFSTAKIYFVAKSFKNSDYIHFIFCTDNMKEIENIKTVNFEEIDKSKEYYLKGISDLKNNLLDSAIDNFTKSYKFDSIRIDAVYKRAEAFFRKGDNEKACKDWNLLMSLDQELAKNKYLENCK